MRSPTRDTVEELERSGRLARLNDRYRAPLMRYFRKRADVLSEAEDMVQEVFLRLAANGMDGVRTEQSYLFATAANVLRDQTRRDGARQRGAHVGLDHAPLPPDNFDAEETVAFREALRQALLALHELPTRTQVIFALHRYEELSHPQIAQRLGLSVSAVEKHIMKAIAHLARRIPR